MNSLLITTNKPYTYDIFLSDLSKLLIKYPNLQKETIGYSVLGKPIYALKVGNGAKKVIITAAHHAKEWITSALLMCIINTLLETENISNTFYFIPMVNPDGVNLCIKGLSQDLPVYVRKRLIMINGSEDFAGKWQANIRGIDLNHNYDASFSKGKALQLKEGIFAPAPTKYSGEYPESEPETKAIVSFTKKISPQMVIAYHSQGEEIFYKYQGKCAPDAEKIAQNLANASGYQLILADGLTDCTGYKDWVIEKFNIPAFTIEVGKGENPLPISQIEKIFSDNLKLILAI
jgi:g-D-glutamyl-meso-diaminopimelate peptidase